jgi:hypothetical protein
MTNVCGAGVLLRYTFDDSSSFHMRLGRASRNQNDSLAESAIARSFRRLGSQGSPMCQDVLRQTLTTHERPRSLEKCTTGLPTRSHPRQFFFFDQAKDESLSND